MDNDQHHVSGFFAHRVDAEYARSTLAERGVPLEGIHLFAADSLAPRRRKPPTATKYSRMYLSMVRWALRLAPALVR